MHVDGSLSLGWSLLLQQSADLTKKKHFVVLNVNPLVTGCFLKRICNEMKALATYSSLQSRYGWTDRGL